MGKKKQIHGLKKKAYLQSKYRKIGLLVINVKFFD